MTNSERLPLQIVFAFWVVAGLCSAQTPVAIEESARQIPVVATVDVVVAGGTTAGVAAALASADEGCSVFLVAPRPHLGEDLVDTLHLWLEDNEQPSGELTRRIFSKPGPVSPLRVKKVLEDALLKVGVRFVFCSIPTDLLIDASGRPAGIVMTNRAGRQAVIAKLVIDATFEASMAASAGARFHPVSDGPITVWRVVMGGAPANEEFIQRRIPVPDEDVTYFEYAVNLDPGADMVAAMRAEHQARELTYRPGQLRASARLWYVPSNSIVGRSEAQGWRGFEHLEAGHFQPLGVDRLYVAGPRADIPRQAAREILLATRAEGVGQFVGATAGREALATPPPDGVCLASGWRKVEAKAMGNLRENLVGLRPTDSGLPSVPAETRPLPVLGFYDVVVIGGGTAGAAAAIGAGRQGAKVLVVEYQEGLGGTGTLGLIGRPYHGQNVGFAREVPFPGEDRTIEDKMEWYRREIRKTGGEIWFGSLGAGALVDGSQVKGVVVATPQGRGVVLSKVVIDATGNADIAVAAGAEWMFDGDASDLAMQGAGLPTRPPRASYVNTDFLLVDETDLVDVWRALVGARMTMNEDFFDSGPLIQTRERRRVVGDHILSYLDQIAGRTYPDSIVYSASDYDSHGYPTDDFFALLPHDDKSRAANHPAPGGAAYTPYRCLLPRGLEGILVAGLGISMHRDASALVRMQRDIANQGYAAGVAAAMAAVANVPPRQIDVKALQKHLVEIGNLPEEVLRHEDSFPLPSAEIEKAVERLGYATNPKEAGKPLAIVLSHRDQALPLLRRAWETGPPSTRLAYAKVLGLLGVRDVVPELVEALDAVGEWDARILQGKMAEYAYLPTPIDSLIRALGRTRDPRALPSLLKKLETLDQSVTLSHHRALAIALENIGDARAAEPLARLLAKPGMQGHAMTSVEPLYNQEVEKRRRLASLREITLARALYRCGDYQDLGKTILMTYQRDLRGLFARHATTVLTE
jgi:flavin-dependent dehydrogenase